MKCVEVVEDEEFERRYPDQYSSAVTITMEDGKTYTAVVDNPKGDKRNPVTHGMWRTNSDRWWAECSKTSGWNGSLIT